MGAPTPASDDRPGDSYSGRHRSAEDLADSAPAIVDIDAVEMRTKPLDGLIRAHGFTGRTGTVQI